MENRTHIQVKYRFKNELLGRQNDFSMAFILHFLHVALTHKHKRASSLPP
uniref:Uncharacterized protein n=1 Tax=Anguilla anguilla TaxID=7936 RepID=A0A0E9X0P3_ANGAN